MTDHETCTNGAEPKESLGPEQPGQDRNVSTNGAAVLHQDASSDARSTPVRPHEGDDTSPVSPSHALPLASPLSNILSLQDFVSTDDGRRLFSSTDSLRWFIKSNYRQLTEAGAIAMQGRRLLIRRPQFDEAFVQVTSDRARILLAV